MSEDATYPMSAVECSFTRTYSAHISMIGVIRNDILGLKEYQSLHPNTQDALIIIITEMMTNAIKHGSRELIHASVTLGLTITEDTITCIFEDSGPGFDRASIPDPTLPEYLHRDHGRGIFITEHLANDVRYLYQDNTMRIIVTL